MSAGLGVANPLCKAGEGGEVVGQLTRVLYANLCLQEAYAQGVEGKKS